MKPPIKLSIFKTLLILLLHILPYAFLSSCSDTDLPAASTSENIETDNSINSTLGMMKVLVTYNNGGTHFQYAMLTQADEHNITFLDHTFTFITKPLDGISSVRVTKWLPGTFWGRTIFINHVVDSMCCTSARYEGSTGNWYMESPEDTIVTHSSKFTVINCYEKCPYGN